MDHVQKKFIAMGARARFGNLRTSDLPLSVDIVQDKKGEYFQVDINHDLGVDVTVQDIAKHLRHLLLVARFMPPDRKYGKKDVVTILCGHDEREWFASRLPENACSVKDAFDKLKPREVLSSQRKHQIKQKNWNKRKNKGFIRQGEFFFIKEDIEADEHMCLRNEPLLMGGGTPHIAQFAYRSGGETVYVCYSYPNGVTHEKYARLVKLSRNFKGDLWQTITRNATLYVKGKVRHPDHATLYLQGWHRVLVNDERRGREVVFLD